MGTVLWEMITGTKLFKGDNDLETIKLVRRCEVPPINSVDRRVDEQLASIVMRALEKDPNQRFQSCEDMSQALVRYLFSIGTAVTNFTIALMVKRMKERNSTANIDGTSEVNYENASATDLDTFASLASTARLEALPQIMQQAKQDPTMKKADGSAHPNQVQIPMAEVPGTSGNDAQRVEAKNTIFDDATLAGIGLGLIGATVVIVLTFLIT